MRPGDIVIQNGANSQVGRAVIQFAKKLGIKTCNIIRDPKNKGNGDENERERQQTVDELKKAGAGFFSSNLN